MDLPALEDFERAFRGLAARKDTLSLDLSPVQAWILMCYVQLALRHPGATGPTAPIARGLAQGLQEILTKSDEVLARMAAAGWQPEHDVPIAGIRPAERSPALIPLPGDTFFRDSPDSGDPACLCSRCGQPIAEDEVAVRIWPKPPGPGEPLEDHQDGEYRYHQACAGIYE